MRRSCWILLSLPLAVAGVLVVAPEAGPGPEGFDVLVISGPRRGAFFSCGCARDRRGGMTLALAHAGAARRVLWIETGEPFGREPEPVREFLRARVAAFRIEGASPDVEVVSVGGRRLRLVFADRLAIREILALPHDGVPLLCVASGFDADILEALRGRRGLYAVGDRPRTGGGSLRVLGYAGSEGRQVLVVSGPDEARRIEVVPIPGLPPDPMDLAYLRARHVSAGVLVRRAGASPAGLGPPPSSCASCHPRTVARWRRSAHAHALDSLDGRAARTCFGCHSVLRDRPPTTEHRFAVSCASCHGVLEGHPGVRAPPRAARCTGCHTRASSPGFRRARAWERIRCGG